MTILEIENNLKHLVEHFSKETFIYDLLTAYDFKKATIKRLQGSELNKLEDKGELTLRKKIFFKVTTEDIHNTIDNLKNDKSALKHSPRFIIVTDYDTLVAFDTKTEDSLDIPILNIANHYDFFLPLAGMEKTQHQDENPADVKAAQKLAKLYDEILQNNHFETQEEIHALNVFLTRLLFCYFAEDTNIFEDNLFTKSIASHTQEDGSDLDIYLDRLFEVFNTEKRSDDTPQYLKVFPYVNGGLFKDKFLLPKFTAKSRRVMIEIGELKWSDINPDIFGSMIQAVVTPEHRGGMGMHYTSVPNIMKVIEPLFLDELYEEFERGYDSKVILNNLLRRISNIKIFDPACGSGNFLIIAYKKLRELEMSILKRIDTLSSQRAFVFSEIKLTQFYGIELDDFAHEVAILSLWLAEHQMNLKFFEEFGRTTPSLPLHAGGNIVHGNATRIDWEEVCPKKDGDEIYILGNPPYVGSKKQSKYQKVDMKDVFNGINGYKNLDYIACWFFIGAKYIKNYNAKLSFVSTNSLIQGDMVGLLWPNIFNLKIEISFAYSSFKWGNNAKGNAGVTVVVIGLSNENNNQKYLYANTFKHKVSSISPYLTANSKIIVHKRTKPLSNLPIMSYGNMPLEGNFLKLTLQEKESLEKQDDKAVKFIKPLIGGDELLKGYKRYCIWIKDNELDEANQINEIKTRIDSVYEFRINGGEVARSLSHRPHQFRYMREAEKNQIIIPCTSSERRDYLTSGFFDKNYITLNSVQVIYDSEPYVFGIISSKMHMLWSKSTAGTLDSRLRYSNMLCYNTFPFPNISDKQKEEITEFVFNILDEREKYSEKTLAQLYDPDKMPDGLKEAHHQLDLAIEKCYRNKPFENDEERLEYLFKLYEEMTTSEVK